MAPSVVFTTWPTPGLPWPACWSDGQVTVDPVPSVQTVGDAAARKPVRFCVVPELSERCATVIAVDGNFTPGLSALIAASSQVLMSPWKIFARVSAESCSFFTPDRLYDTVIGAATVGK